jgi:hypothetical protein
MTHPFRKATTVREAQWACELTPLPQGDPRWVDFKEIRGADVQGRLKRLLIKPESAKGTFSHITFAGHRGCGKSTELLQASKALRENRFFVVYCLANEELDLTDIEYSDLLLAASKVLVEEVGRQFPLDEKLLEQLTKWFAEITETDITTIKKEIELKTSAEGGAKIPFLASVLAKLTALIKAGEESRKEIRQKVLKSPDQLIFSVNQILDECHRAIRAGGPYDELLLIIDNLDRYPRETVHRVLIEQADNLKRLRCNIIYTVPISLIYEPAKEALPDVFKNVVLPMIKIRTREQLWTDTDVFQPGIDRLAEVMERRIDIDEVFSNRALVTKLVLKSGGSLRELMRLIQEACLETNGEKIDAPAVEKAIVSVRTELTRPMPQTYLAELAKIHQSKQTDNASDQLRILFYRYALEYLEGNGERWVDVHPLIYDMPEFQQLIRGHGRAKRTKTKKADA